jgi:hypothetical protein
MKKYLLSVCLLLLAGLVFSQSAPTKDQVAQAAELLGVSESDLQKWVDSKFVAIPIGISEITAMQLYQEYEASQPKADRTYKGKQIKITGTVGAIEETRDNNYKKRYALEFKTDALFNLINVFFLDSDLEPLFDIAVGQTVSIIGTVIEKKSHSIVIDNAKIID